jgi:hypothetical protein
MSNKLQIALAEIERLRSALTELKAGITEHATDTVWFDQHETACERIDNILDGVPAVDLNLILDQAYQGVFVEHDCPAMYACAAIIVEFGESRVKAYTARQSSKSATESGSAP